MTSLRPAKITILSVVSLLGAWVSPVQAFDFIGLFGEPEKATPNAQSVAYDVSFSGLDDVGAVE